MDADVQLRVHQAVFILIARVSIVFLPLEQVPHLSRRVDDFCEERLALVDDLVAEGILDRGVIAFDEVALAVLDCEGRFACALRSVCVHPQSSR